MSPITARFFPVHESTRANRVTPDLHAELISSINSTPLIPPYNLNLPVIRNPISDYLLYKVGCKHADHMAPHTSPSDSTTTDHLICLVHHALSILIPCSLLFRFSCICCYQRECFEYDSGSVMARTTFD
jgi:hypothetical protein